MLAKLAKQVIERSGGVCENCNSNQGPLDIHHILFKSHGGRDEIENLILLCRECHERAHGIRKPRIPKQDLFNKTWEV